MHFYEWKISNFDLNFTEICYKGSNWYQVNIGSGNGWAPTRWQDIIWTYSDPVHCCIYVALGGDELTSLRIAQKHIKNIYQTENL